MMKFCFTYAFGAGCASVAAACTLFATLPALAADDGAATPATPAAAEARYDRERSRCLAGQSQEDQKTCLREAGAALQAARQHQLTSDSPDQLAANARRRCDPLPPDDKKDCLARMSGEGTVTGSVAGGGLLRELVTVVPAPQPAPVQPETAPPASAGPTPTPAPTPTLPPTPPQ
jgi:hypothetical protein